MSLNTTSAGQRRAVESSLPKPNYSFQKPPCATRAKKAVKAASAPVAYPAAAVLATGSVAVIAPIIGAGFGAAQLGEVCWEAGGEAAESLTESDNWGAVGAVSSGALGGLLGLGGGAAVGGAAAAGVGVLAIAASPLAGLAKAGNSFAKFLGNSLLGRKTRDNKLVADAIDDLFPELLPIRLEINGYGIKGNPDISAVKHITKKIRKCKTLTGDEYKHLLHTLKQYNNLEQAALQLGGKKAKLDKDGNVKHKDSLNQMKRDIIDFLKPNLSGSSAAANASPPIRALFEKGLSRNPEHRLDAASVDQDAVSVDQGAASVDQGAAFVDQVAEDYKRLFPVANPSKEEKPLTG